jgi:hypothetical protein
VHGGATILFVDVLWNTKTKETFLSDGKVVCSEKMHQCACDCDSEVATDEAIYHSQLREVQEWPFGWPETFSKSVTVHMEY